MVLLMICIKYLIISCAILPQGQLTKTGLNKELTSLSFALQMNYLVCFIKRQTDSTSSDLWKFGGM